MIDPVKYEMDPKVIINELIVNYRCCMHGFAFDVTKPMKNKIKVRHLLNLYIQPFESLTIELADKMPNRDTFLGIL
jgi:hypothetical protein